MEKPCYGLQVTSKKTKVRGTRIKDKGERRKEKEIKEGWKVGIEEERKLQVPPKSRYRKRNRFPSLSLRAPERYVAISLKKTGLLRFTRHDNFLNRDLGSE
jgi:hypothetical protein